MKEKIVSFELAKLAKQKGFHHMKANCYGDNMCYNLDDPTPINALIGNTVIGYVLAPTLSLLQAWLREEKEVYVTVMPWSKYGDYTAFVTNETFVIDLQNTPKTSDFEEYDDALEQGLTDGLNLLKNENNS